MRVLFDTTALYVAAGVAAITFTPKVRRLLEHSETVRLASPVSFNEIAIKANASRPNGLALASSSSDKDE